EIFNGIQDGDRKIAWVKWSKVLPSKKYERLEVSSFYALNRALLFKWVWHYLSHDNSLWSRVISAIHGLNGQVLSAAFNSTWSSMINEVNSLKIKVSISFLTDRWFWDLNGDGVFRIKDVRILLDEAFLPKMEVPTRWIKSIPIKNLDFQYFDSYDGWLSWFKSIRLGSKAKDVLEGVFYVSCWSL
nr:RNA-directed DNA polymerase, eukaryota, reverse transcriptase zinc-binding domain protein [Tanacetum cinerariifolium]